MERELWRWDAVDLAAAIRTRRISSREVTQAVLERLSAVNPALNAVTVLLADQALAAADRADAAVRRGDALGVLHGVPVTIKENVDQEGAATSDATSSAPSMPTLAVIRSARNPVKSVSPSTPAEGISRLAVAEMRNARCACCTTTSSSHQKTKRCANEDATCAEEHITARV